ncbi:hypothetical protein Z043_118659, partial [Scleropages formosus]
VSGGGGSAGFLGSLVAYLFLAASVGFAAFLLQRVREEVAQLSSKSDISFLRSSELDAKMNALRQQVDAMKETASGYDSTFSNMRAELDSVGQVQRRGEAETRRVEEALQRLQKEILKDLSDGIQEVKQTRQRDFSSLERSIDERLAELSGSIGESVAGVAEVQAETHSQLQDLRARLEGLADPVALRQELQGVVASVAELQTSTAAVGKTTDSLTEQISAVGAELQTRNKEVASQSEEIGSVRAMVQSTAGTLRQSLSAVEVTVQALSDQTQNLQMGIDGAAGGLQSLERELRGALEQSERSTEDLQARMRIVEESTDAVAASLTEQAAKLESSLSKYESHENRLAALARDADSTFVAAQKEVRQLQANLQEVNHTQQSLGNLLGVHKTDLAELQSTVTALDSKQTELVSRLSSQTQQIEDWEQRVGLLGDEMRGSQLSDLKASVSQLESDLKQLRTAVDSLVVHSVKVERHQEAITSLQRDLEETRAALKAQS